MFFLAEVAFAFDLAATGFLTVLAIAAFLTTVFTFKATGFLTVAFLAADSSNSITGTSFMVDGGWTAK